MVTQRCFGWPGALHLRNAPRPRTRSAAWITDIGRQRLALFYFRHRTNCGNRGKRALLWRRIRGTSRCCFRFAALAPDRRDEFSVNAIAKPATLQIIPQKTGCGIVDVRDSLFQRKLLGHAPSGVVGPFFAAIGDGPGLLVVIGSS